MMEHNPNRAGARVSIQKRPLHIVHVRNVCYPDAITGEDIQAGEVLYVSGDDTFKLADDTSAIRNKVAGVAHYSALNGRIICVVVGGVIEVTADGAISAGDTVTPAATAGRVKTMTRTHQQEIPEEDISHTHAQADTGGTLSSHTHDVGNPDSTFTLFQADAPTTHNHGLASHAHGLNNHTHGGEVSAQSAVSQGTANSSVRTRTGKTVPSSSHHHTAELGGVSHVHTNPNTGTGGSGVHTHGSGSTTTDRDPGAPTTLDFITGKVLGKAMTGACGAGDKLKILVSLG